VIVYSPLGRGLLTGKYRAGEQPPEGTRGAAGEKRLQQLMAQERNFAIVEGLKPLAENRGWTLAQFALAWVLSRPVVTSAILGASRPEHILDAVPATEYRLTKDELGAVDEICGAAGANI